MEVYLIIMIIVMIVAIIALIFFSSYTKLKKYKDKMIKAENIIDENLNKKLDLVIAINSSVNKATGKKDYLKEYISIRDLIITNIEKDLKLDEAEKLIYDLVRDFEELNNDDVFLKNINELRKIDELLVSAKNMFNHNAVKSNQLIKNFPNNLVAKLANFKIRSFYNNKTDSEETF